MVQPPVGGDQQAQPTVDGQPPPVPDQPLDLDAENARVAAEVAINIATEQQEADIYDTRQDYQHFSVCRYGYGYCPREAVFRVSSNISPKK